MRILCLTSRLPYPPDRGDRLRAFNFIKRLSRDHEIVLVSFIANRIERKLVSSLLPYCQEVHVQFKPPVASILAAAVNFWRLQPLQTSYYGSRAMQRLVDDQLEQATFDAAYIHLFRMAPYLDNHDEIYRIMDLTDVISSEIARSLSYRGRIWRLIYSLERSRIARFERNVAREFEEVWLISNAESQALAADCPGANLHTVPNGVNLERFHHTAERPSPNSLLFFGHMRVFHNVDAAIFLAREVLPRVKELVPGVSLTIAGAEPGIEILALAEDPAIKVVGYVEDLNGQLNQAAVFVAPLRFAAGVQNKVLEAMAAARPVVTTTVVNEGLGAQAGRDLLVADDPDSIARAIVHVLENEQESQRLGSAARVFVQERFTWEHVASRMAAIEATILG